MLGRFASYDQPVPADSHTSKPIVAVTLGDPGGIGPEVIVKALADSSLRARARFRIYGPAAPLGQAAAAAGIRPFWRPLGEEADADAALLDYRAARPNLARAPSVEGGDISYRIVEDAIADALRAPSDPRRVDAVVTGPISKEAWALAGHGRYPGHTELFAERCRAARAAMFFHAPQLNVVLATVHVPLMRVLDHLTIGRIYEVIELGRDACRRLGILTPRIAVCGLNPHAGEHGLLGDEEQRLISPAVEIAREAGIDATGPHAPDSVFLAASRGRFDLVVAMYHDQGLIPLKLLARDRAVNTTLGLPTIRTSPDHGTAFDIAGRNLADPGSMSAALDLAVRLSTPL